MSDFKEIDKAAKALETAKKKREQAQHQVMHILEDGTRDVSLEIHFNVKPIETRASA